MQSLSESELRDALQTLGGWSIENGKLHREFRFEDFARAFGFMTMAALSIEKIDHHPEWCNVYNRVTVNLTTHDSGGITGKDVELAKILDAAAGQVR